MISIRRYNNKNKYAFKKWQKLATVFLRCIKNLIFRPSVWLLIKLQTSQSCINTKICFSCKFSWNWAISELGIVIDATSHTKLFEGMFMVKVISQVQWHFWRIYNSIFAKLDNSNKKTIIYKVFYFCQNQAYQLKNSNYHQQTRVWCPLCHNPCSVLHLSWPAKSIETTFLFSFFVYFQICRILFFCFSLIHSE